MSQRSLSEERVGNLTTIAYHWNQACAAHELAEKHCTMKAIEYWHRAAEVAYSSSSLMEALRCAGLDSCVNRTDVPLWACRRPLKVDAPGCACASMMHGLTS